MIVADRLRELGEAASDISVITNEKRRYEGGTWLQNELVLLDDGHTMTPDERLDFMAIVRVLLDVILKGDDHNQGKPELRTPGGLIIPT